jgi:hypothetical protein
MKRLSERQSVGKDLAPPSLDEAVLAAATGPLDLTLSPGGA